MTSKVALVTGGNKGIGFAICARLVRDRSLTVLLSGRDRSSVDSAVAELNSTGATNVHGLVLDLDDVNSIRKAADHVKSTYGGLDILINNAAIAWHGDAFDETVARTTIGTNYFGTRAVCECLLPLVRAHGRVVVVSSMAAQSALRRVSPQLQQKFLAPQLTLEELDALMRQFVSDVAAGRWQEQGWPKTAYGVSKIGESMLTRILARDCTVPGVLVNCCCPGYVNTDMSSHKGPKTPDQGADTPVFLALLAADARESGKFFSDRTVQEWM